MTTSRKIFKLFIRAIGVLLIILLLLLVLINLPPVQDRLTGYTERFLKKKTQAEISIEKISINFLGHILIKEIFVPDPKQDTLLHLGKLEVGFQLRELFRKRIRIKSVELADVLVDVHPLHDTVMNYQYLIDAFNETTVPDEASAEEAEPPADSSASAWDVILPHARLELNRIEFDYCMPDSATVMNYRIGRFLAMTKRVDLLTGAIGLDQLALEDSEVYIKMTSDTTETPTDTSTAPLNYQILAEELALKNVGYRMDLDDLQIDSRVGSAVALDNRVDLLPDTMRIEIARFDLSGSRYRMDTPSAPPAPGFDYNHMDLNDIQIQISDFHYDNLDITGVVRQLAARDHSGFELSGFRSRVHYAPELIELWNWRTATPNSSIDAAHAKVTFPFLEDSTLFEQMRIDLQLDSMVLAPSDLAFFVPQLEEQDFFRQHREQPLRLKARVNGTPADLVISRFELRGWGAYAGLTGRLQHVADVDRLVTDLRINAIESTGPGIRRWLAPGTLPDYIELPENILLRGQVRGPLRRLDLNLEATTSRPAQPLAARLQMNGRISDVMDTDRLSYNLRFDTLWVSRLEMDGYLPDSFPAYILLPEAVTLAGGLQGTMDTVFADLLLEALRDSLRSEIEIAGRVDSFTNTDALAFDLHLRELVVQPGEIAAYLPDSTLPDYFRLPLVQHGEGTFRGDRRNLDAQFEVLTSDGSLNAAAMLEDSSHFSAALDVRDFQLQGLFTDSIAFDSVVGWPAPPIALQVKAEGNGLDIERDLRADASLRLRFLGDTINWREGLLLDGTVDRKSFRGKLTVHENEVDLDFSTLADFNPGRDTSALEGEINNLDLYALKVLDTPFDLQTDLSLTAKGHSIDSVYANMLAQDFRFTYDSISEATQLLFLSFNRDTAANILTAVFSSEFLEAYLVDQANNPEYFNEGIPRLAEKAGVELEKLQLNPDSIQNLFFSLNVIRPELFTSGLIPGLTELKPFQAMAAFDLQDSSFLVHTNISHLKYQSFQLDSTEIAAVNWDSLFFAGISIDSARLFNQIGVKDLKLTGVQRYAGADTLIFNLTQLDTVNMPDEQFPIRFTMAALVDRSAGNYRARFSEKPILNFDTLWRFDPANEIVYDNGELHVRNLTLSRQNRTLSVNEVSPGRLQVDFDNFDLTFFSDILKWKSDMVMGVADGEVVIDNPMEAPEIRADLSVADFGFLAAELGNLDLQAAGDSTGAWDAALGLTGQGNDIALNGAYRPGEDSTRIDGRLTARPLNLAAFGPMAEAFATDLSGNLNTDLTFGGALNNPRVTGPVTFDQVTVRPVITNSLLSIPGGQIDLRGAGVVNTQPLVIKDSLGNEAGLVLIVNWKRYPVLEFGTFLDADNFLVLNTTQADNDLYYGRVFSSIGLTALGATDSVVLVNCELKPRPGSSLFYVYDQGDQLEDLETGEGFVEFVDFDLADREAETTPGLEQDSTKRKASGFDINITADLSRELALTVVMDRESGDRLEGLAQGSIGFRYAPSGDMELSGQIDVSGSKYFYTYQNVIKKEFDLKDGSTITFTGPIDDAAIDLKAGYTARTTPYLLVRTKGNLGEEPSEADLDRLKRRQEFLVTIRAQGTLEAADLSTDIEYPRIIGNNSADLVDPALAVLRTNSTETNTQAFSLILFNSFRLSDGGGGGKTIINLKQELGDLLASQLNNLANQYINFVDVNFGIETLSDDADELSFENTDFRMGLRKRFLDKRLEVEVDGVARTGQVKRDEYGNEYRDQNMQAFLENVSVAYSLTKDGALKIRVFNQYDYDDLIGSNVIKLGGTLVLSKDFNRLIFKKNHQPANHAPEIPPVMAEPADSVQTEGRE